MGNDRASAYATAVVSGERMAGPDIRNACKRHLDDLENGEARGIVYSHQSAMRAIFFFENVLRLNGGEHEGKPFILLDWQAFIVSSIFGWKQLDGTRRYRNVYVESGKGSGKSPLAAGVGLYCLIADNEPRAEVYAAATKMDQARILFNDALAMIDQSPELGQILMKNGKNPVNRVSMPSTGSVFRPISSDNGQSGYRPHCALIDEVHEHKNPDVINLMRAGTKGRKNPLFFMITNSGHDRTSICYDYHEYGKKVAAQAVEDDSFFSFICSLDEGDDPFKDKSCWGKANPSLGQTFGERYLEEQVREARGMPSKESTVRRLNFCQWVEASNPWMSMDSWMKVEDRDTSIESLAGKRCYGGLDLSGKRDLTALALYFPDEKVLYVELWTPRDTMLERVRTDRVPYDAWVRGGFLHAPPGNSIDYSFVAERISRLSLEFDIQAVAFDKYHIDYLEREFAGSVAVPFVPHPQGFFKASESGLWMPHSVELLEAAIADEDIKILYNPVLRWNAASAVLISDAKENRMFDKKRATGRIDGIVASAMALGAADDNAGGPAYNVDDFLNNMLSM